MDSNCLIIFIKNPVLGKVKTRLASSIGNEKALEVYLQLLQHTCDISSKLPCKKLLFYSDCIIENDLWVSSSFEKHLQQGSDLGEKMENAFQKAFKMGYKKVSIIGSDCFDISSNTIKNCFKKLTNCDVVIGPAEDGGYYLLGLKKLASPLFTDMTWSTSNVLQETKKRIEKLNWKTIELETLNDIDNLKDLNRHLTK